MRSVSKRSASDVLNDTQSCLASAGFIVEEVLEREPYPPEVEHQSRRAYLVARKPSASAPGNR